MKSNFLIILIPLVLACATKETSDKPQLKASLSYNEKYRPQFHFSPEANWMNDPNGMVYFEREYHLFYQYYPDSTVWGPMHWGHAVSTDLVHWEHLPIALYPDKLGYIFSGSAVIDWDNTTGFGDGSVPPMVAIYTYHDPIGAEAGNVDCQTQGIAYSLDKGRSWTKYKGNPVIQNPGIRDFRDPKVAWNKTHEKWIMTLAVKDHISFYSSKDLLSWKFESDFGKEHGSHIGVWECPDLFQITDKDGINKYVLLVSVNSGGPFGGSATQYFVGDFDGSKFDSETTRTLWLDYGKDNYAGVTWSDIPERDGRRLFIGWMSNWEYANIVPTEKWRSAMTVSRSLELVKTQEDYILTSNPVKELEKIRSKSHIIGQRKLAGTVRLSDEISFASNLLDMEFEIELVGNTQEIGFQFQSTQNDTLRVGYRVDKNEYFVDRTKSGNNDFSQSFSGVHGAQKISALSRLKFRIILDASSVELFADDGKIIITDLIFPKSPLQEIFIYSKGGESIIHSGTIHKMRSIWHNNDL